MNELQVKWEEGLQYPLIDIDIYNWVTKNPCKHCILKNNDSNCVQGYFEYGYKNHHSETVERVKITCPALKELIKENKTYNKLEEGSAELDKDTYKYCLKRKPESIREDNFTNKYIQDYERREGLKIAIYLASISCQFTPLEQVVFDIVCKPVSIPACLGDEFNFIKPCKDKDKCQRPERYKGEGCVYHSEIYLNPIAKRKQGLWIEYGGTGKTLQNKITKGTKNKTGRRTPAFLVSNQTYEPQGANYDDSLHFDPSVLGENLLKIKGMKQAKIIGNISFAENMKLNRFYKDTPKWIKHLRELFEIGKRLQQQGLSYEQILAYATKNNLFWYKQPLVRRDAKDKSKEKVSTTKYSFGLKKAVVKDLLTQPAFQEVLKDRTLKQQVKTIYNTFNRVKKKLANKLEIRNKKVNANLDYYKSLYYFRHLALVRNRITNPITKEIIKQYFEYQYKQQKIANNLKTSQAKVSKTIKKLKNILNNRIKTALLGRKWAYKGRER